MASRVPDKPSEPDDAQLGGTLGKARRYWDEIVTHVDGLTGVTRAWKLYAGKHGWQLKVQHKKAALLYLIPREGHFMAAMALDDKAVQSLPASGLPAEVVASILAARPSIEGRPARIEVRAPEEVAVVKTLLAMKLDSKQRRSAPRPRARR